MPALFFARGLHGMRTLPRMTLLALIGCAAVLADETDRYDAVRALHISLAAVGNTVGDYTLKDTTGAEVDLRPASAGRPLVVSMIYTSCQKVCPETTRHLADAVASAQQVLGEDSFDVVSVGFDTEIDTPEAMAAFAQRHDIPKTGWRFLSASEETVRQLSADLGFIFFPSETGFDHINQSTIVDGEGKVYAQVHGVYFDLPALVEPLKDLVLGRPATASRMPASVTERVRLFCTIYNRETGRYEFDDARVLQIVAAAIFVLAVVFFLVREFLLSRRQAGR